MIYLKKKPKKKPQLFPENVFSANGLKMNEKAADVQSKPLKAGKAIAQDHFTQLQASVAPRKQNMKKVVTQYLAL